MRQTHHSPALLTALVAIVGCWSVPHATAARTAELQIEAVTIGFAGKYKVGYWTPVWVTISAPAGTVEGKLALTTLDGDGAEVRYADAEQATVIPAGQRTRLLRYVKFGRLRGGLAVEFRSTDGTTTTHRVAPGDLTNPLEFDQAVIVTLGSDIGVGDAFDTPADRLTTALVERARLLPDRWYGYEGVDVMVITTRSNPVLEQLTDEQFTAIERWASLGGRILLCLGDRGRDVLTGADAALGRLAVFVPGEFADVITVRNASALENYAGSGDRLEITGDNLPRMTLLQNVKGLVELDDLGLRGRRPMVVRAPFRFGQVTFVAFDLDASPLREWPGRARMVGRILQAGRPGDQPRASNQPTGQVAHLGYTDLAGQLRGALDQFQGVSFVAFSWVAGLILVYVLLIGPADYFLLKKVVRRMQLTWITFPLIAILFSIAAVLLNQQLKGQRLLINQVDLVDIDLETSLVRGTMWAHVYSPHAENFDFQLTSTLRQSPAGNSTILSWQGLPGTGLGGLNSPRSSASFAGAYTVTSAPSANMIRAKPIQVASTTSLTGRWWDQAERRVDTQLSRDGELLQGAVVNPLDVELTDCLVLYGDYAYRLESTRGVLAPRASTRVELERPLNLEWRLTRSRMVETKNVTTPWDQNSFDVPRIMEMMMFHRAAGGDRYTQLTNRYQAFVDLSDHLRSGRAILLGRLGERASELSIDGEQTSEAVERHWAFCRIVLPVTSTQRAR